MGSELWLCLWPHTPCIKDNVKDQKAASSDIATSLKCPQNIFKCWATFLMHTVSGVLEKHRVFSEYPPRAKHCAERLTHINSFDPHKTLWGRSYCHRLHTGKETKAYGLQKSCPTHANIKNIMQILNQTVCLQGPHFLAICFITPVEVI